MPDFDGLHHVFEGESTARISSESAKSARLLSDPTVNFVLRQLPRERLEKFVQSFVIQNDRVVGLSTLELSELKHHEIIAVLVHLGFLVHPSAVSRDSSDSISLKGNADYTQDYVDYSCIPTMYFPKGECQEKPGHICSKDCGK